MYLTPSPRALLPHEINRIEQIFREVLRERGLTQQCKEAEVIAKRLMDLYLGGVREGVALKYLIFLDEPGASGPWQNERPLIEEVSMLDITRQEGTQLSPDQIDMLQRTFDRVCIWCNIPRYGKRAVRLARHIADQFRKGMCDESALFENATWLQRNSDDRRPHDA